MTAYRNLYYEHYRENESLNYWELEDRVLPYMVLIHDKHKRENFRKFLISEGFECVTWNDSYPGVLVNMQFRRFGLIHRPCNFAHVNNHDYTLDEFMNKIYNTPEKKV